MLCRQDVKDTQGGERSGAKPRDDGVCWPRIPAWVAPFGCSEQGEGYSPRPPPPRPLQIRGSQRARARNVQVRPGSANPPVGAHSPHSLREITWAPEASGVSTSSSPDAPAPVANRRTLRSPVPTHLGSRDVALICVSR